MELTALKYPKYSTFSIKWEFVEMEFSCSTSRFLIIFNMFLLYEPFLENLLLVRAEMGSHFIENVLYFFGYPCSVINPYGRIVFAQEEICDCNRLGNSVFTVTLPCFFYSAATATAALCSQRPHT